MARSRADEILGGWKMVAHSASKPADAPRPNTYRTALPIGVLGTAAIVLVLLVGLSLRGGFGPGPRSTGIGGQPTASSSPSESPSATPSAPETPSTGPTTPPSPVPTPTRVPTATGNALPSQTPSAADVAAAGQTVDRYTADLVRGDYAAAWAMLAPEAQAAQGSLAAFTSERSAFFQSVAGRYTVKTSPTDVGPITNWLTPTQAGSIDLGRAVLVEVDYPAIAASNAWSLYVVAPGPKGLLIYEVR